MQWRWLLSIVVCSGVFAADMKELVARADLDYDKPAARTEEGMPLGNGRMGSLIWTSPSAIKFQINRNDVFAINSTTTSFPRPHTDYATGCAFADITFSDFESDAFSGGEFRQHLSVYDGVITTRGKGISTRTIACADRDVFAIEIDDQRPQPGSICIDLRMLRYATQYIRGRSTTGPATNPHANTVQTGAHSATSDLHIQGGRIVLTQQFRERDYYNATAVVAAIVGRAGKAEIVNQSTVRLAAAPGKGKFVILIASAATFDREQDVTEAAIKHLPDKSFDQLLSDNQKAWHDFWSRGHIQLHSEDGTADFVEQNYTYFLYVMNSCSRGDFPTHFNGMLWATNGDLHAWGSEYWWANQSCYYNGLDASNRPELLDPTLALYSRMHDSCAFAAEQQWGSKGIWIPETGFFDGLAKLPDDIAAEMRDLYLLRKPWKDRSENFMQYASAMQTSNSRWNWIAQDGHYEMGRWIMQDKGAPPFGHVTHIFGTTAKIALLYWQRYQYTRDETWLRDRAYPMLKGAVEFYRNFPNLKKDADGKYHLYHTNSNEPAWGVKDSDEDMAALHGILPVMIRASEILDLDADMRPLWREFLQNLAPMPTSDNPDALRPDNYNGPIVWVKGLKPAFKAGGLLPDGNTLAAWNFDLCTVNTDDPGRLELANRTFNAYLRTPPGPQSRSGTLSRVAIAGAQLGRADAVQYLVPAQMRSGERSAIFRNRLALREGPGATECERLGRAAEALHNALLQSAPPSPATEPIITVFPAWPKTWDASFKLLARGAFLVSASIEQGKIGAVTIESKAGGACRVKNPWGDAPVIVAGKQLTGNLLTFDTTKGENIVIKKMAP